jgi:hypothetical protein
MSDNTSNSMKIIGISSGKKFFALDEQQEQNETYRLPGNESEVSRY